MTRQKRREETGSLMEDYGLDDLFLEEISAVEDLGPELADRGRMIWEQEMRRTEEGRRREEERTE
jgi:hypothetical protein